MDGDLAGSSSVYCQQCRWERFCLCNVLQTGSIFCVLIFHLFATLVSEECDRVVSIDFGITDTF